MKWIDAEIDLFPYKSGAYVCVVRGATDIRLMRFNKEENKWKSSNGVETKKVTHWFEIPSLPPAIQMNILLKKATEQGLTSDERIELSNLLRS